MTMTTDARAVESRETIADGFSVPVAGRHLHAVPQNAPTATGTSPDRCSPTLHLLFETQYNEFALAVDLIAERHRALDAHAPASDREFARYTTIDEDDDRPDAGEMIRRLLAGQDAVIRTARSIFPSVKEVPRRSHGLFAAHTDQFNADLLDFTKT